MIDQERQTSALYALHDVLIRARSMALAGASSEDFAFILDWAELLPMHLASPFDQTKEFRMALEALAERFPAFTSAIRSFDNIEGIKATRRRQEAAAARISETATR